MQQTLGDIWQKLWVLGVADPRAVPVSTRELSSSLIYPSLMSRGMDVETVARMWNTKNMKIMI